MATSKKKSGHMRRQQWCGRKEALPPAVVGAGGGGGDAQQPHQIYQQQHHDQQREQIAIATEQSSPIPVSPVSKNLVHRRRRYQRRNSKCPTLFLKMLSSSDLLEMRNESIYRSSTSNAAPQQPIVTQFSSYVDKNSTTSAINDHEHDRTITMITKHHQLGSVPKRHVRLGLKKKEGLTTSAFNNVLDVALLSFRTP